MHAVGLVLHPQRDSDERRERGPGLGRAAQRPRSWGSTKRSCGCTARDRGHAAKSWAGARTCWSASAATGRCCGRMRLADAAAGPGARGQPGQARLPGRGRRARTARRAVGHRRPRVHRSSRGWRWTPSSATRSSPRSTTSPWSGSPARPAPRSRSGSPDHPFVQLRGGRGRGRHPDRLHRVQLLGGRPDREPGGGGAAGHPGRAALGLQPRRWCCRSPTRLALDVLPASGRLAVEVDGQVARHVEPGDVIDLPARPGAGPGGPAGPDHVLRARPAQAPPDRLSGDPARRAARYAE